MAIRIERLDNLRAEKWTPNSTRDATPEGHRTTCFPGRPRRQESVETLLERLVVEREIEEVRPREGPCTENCNQRLCLRERFQPSNKGIVVRLEAV
jgi:hypothetical protein